MNLWFGLCSMLRYLAGMALISAATLYTWITRHLKGEKPSFREIWKELNEKADVS